LGFGEKYTAAPPGDLYGCEKKGFAGKGIRKSVKTKSEQFDVLREPHRVRGVPHPRCFAKRVGKLLKTNDGSCKKRGKRVQEAASF
jgi:hypothetical protein